MLKLAKYLKPFAALLAGAIILLFVQAMCDLTLPDYMSNIVNKGIQQGGILNSVPEAISEAKMKKLTIFMDDNDKKEVESGYELLQASNADYDSYMKKYPNAKVGGLYVRKDISSEDKDKLNLIMGKAFLSVSGVDKMKAGAQNGIIDFNGQKIPASTDLFMLFANLPAQMKQKITDDMNKQFVSLGENMINQAASVAVKAELKELGADTDKIQSNYIIMEGVYMLLISLFSAFCTVLVGFLAARTAAGVSRNLRKDVFTTVESFSNIEFDKFSTASLITRTTNDITQIQMLIVMAIRMIVYAPIIGIGGVIKALSRSVSMSWTIGLAVVVLLGLIGTVFVVALPKFRVIQKLIDRLNLVSRENLSGMMVIRAFNTQSFEESRFDKANIDLTNVNLFVNRIMVIVFPAMMFVMNGVTLLIVWVGAHQIADSSMQVGDMMAFMQYAMQILFAFMMMSFMFIMIPRASVSAQRISEVLETKPSIVDPKQPRKFTGSVKGEVEFKHVHFRYPGAEDDVLHDISFKAVPGQTTAIIGSTGSGKSTMVNLLPRFYDVTEGEVLVDGVNIKDVTQYDLREHIGYVPQKGSLFHGTIESNLKYANENTTAEEMRKAAEIAQAMEFINEKEEGFASEISQGGSNVSGGQKQRLSIARALVKKPQIYIFDDSFSALDFKTDSALRKALRDETDSSTFIIVAQRISTIMHAEQIIVLDEGRIVGLGTHEELLENCETYQEIAYSQLSKEELA